MEKRCSLQRMAHVVKAVRIWRKRVSMAGKLQSQSYQDSSRQPPKLAKPPDLEGRSMPSHAQVRSGKALLDQRCAFFSLEQVDMVGDGNCQFRALAQELYGTQEHHALIRETIVDHMHKHNSDFSFLFEDGEWENYMCNIAQPCTWGDELTLRAAVDAFQIRAHVITSNDRNWYLVYDPSSGAHSRQVFITYIAPIHYNTVEPRF